MPMSKEAERTILIVYCTVPQLWTTVCVQGSVLTPKVLRADWWHVPDKCKIIGLDFLKQNFLAPAELWNLFWVQSFLQAAYH